MDYRRDALEDAIGVYVAAFSQPGALRAGFEDYRARKVDVEVDDRSYEAGVRVTVPLLVLGEAGLAGRLPVLDIWRDYATDVRGEGLAECGHFLLEERPEAVLGNPRDFLELYSGSSPLLHQQHADRRHQRRSTPYLSPLPGECPSRTALLTRLIPSGIPREFPVYSG